MLGETFAEHTIGNERSYMASSERARGRDDAKAAI
jgi:hypothetical protein